MVGLFNIVQESEVRTLQSWTPLNILKLSSFILSLLQLACLKPPSYLRMLKTRFTRGVNFSISSSAVLHKSLTATMQGSRNAYTVLSFHRLLSVLPASLPTFWLYAKRRIEELFLSAFAKLRKAIIGFVVSIRPSARNNSAPTGRISMKFDIWVCFENLTKSTILYVKINIRLCLYVAEFYLEC